MTFGIRTVLGLGALTVAALAGCGGATPTSDTSPGSAPAANAPSGEEPTSPDAPEASTGSGVLFKFKPPEPGQRRIETQEVSVSLDLTEKKGEATLGTMKTVEVDTTKKETTVLAVDGNVITKKKVRYIEKAKTVRQGDRGGKQPSPLSGRTYVVELRGGKPAFSADGGRQLAEIEEQALTRENENFGKPPRFARIFPETPLDQGQVFTPPKEVLKNLFGRSKGERTIADVRFEFVGLKDLDGRSVGEIKVRQKITESQQGTVVTFDVAGAILVDRETAWPRLLDVGGDVSFDGPGRKPGTRIVGKGVVAMKIAARYE